jgi:hypothetical protein
MTQAGKYLIVANLALSLIFAAWALAIYGNRVDWGDTAERPDVVRGKYNERKAELTAAVAARDKAVARWEKALDRLRSDEADKPRAQQWYAEQLKILETGTDAKGQGVANPVQQLAYKQGQLQLDRNTGRPLLEPIEWTRTQPLLDLTRLGQEYNKTMKDLTAEKETLDKLLAEEQRLTEEVNGDGKQKKGLRTLVAEQEQERQNSLIEQDYLRPLLYNRLVESQLVRKRQRTLESRLRELQGTKVGAHLPRP